MVGDNKYFIDYVYYSGGMRYLETATVYARNKNIAAEKLRTDIYNSFRGKRKIKIIAVKVAQY